MRGISEPTTSTRTAKPKMQSPRSKPHGDYLINAQVFAVVAGEFSDALDGDLGGVVEVIHHDDGEPLEEELQHGVAPDVARAARDQHASRHGRGAGTRGGGDGPIEGKRNDKVDTAEEG